MFGLATRLTSGIFTPLINQASATGARVLRKLALFLVAGLAMIVVLVALTIAFGLWISSLKGPIVGALAVAGLYFTVVVGAVTTALWPRKKATASGATAGTGAPKATDDPVAAAAFETQIDEFAAPLLQVLERIGLRREQLAVLAGTSIAKQIGPLPLVGLAIIAGFLIGRMWGGLRGLISLDLIDKLVGTDLLSAMFRRTAGDRMEDAPAENPRTEDAPNTRAAA